MLLGVKATHVMSAEITYKHIVNDSYSVTLKVYRDCNGIQVSNSPIRIKSGCSLKSVYLNPVSVIDVTRIPAGCGINSRCSGSYKYGIEEHTFSGGFKLPNDTCCNYTLSWEQCCRNSAITTGAADQNYYIETKFNKCLAPYNSSPSFVDIPTFLIGVGANHNISNAAIDTIDNDLLTYELIKPFSASGTAISYSGSFSPYRPLTFFGFPNAGLALPQGFHFDSLTANISFRPIIANQVTVMAQRVNEWRKINGVYTKIGEVIRDVQVIIYKDSLNSAPEFIKSNPKIALCSELKPYCITIPIIDSNATDTVTLKYTSNIQGITFTNIGTKPSEPVVEVCFTLDSAKLNSLALLRFTISASDNKCPLPVKVEKTYYLEIKDHLPDSFAVKSSFSNCREIETKLINNSSVNNLITSWKMWNVKDTFVLQGDTTIFKNSFNDTGWVYTLLKITSGEHCDEKLLLDSVYIAPERLFKISLGQDKAYCFKTQDTLELADTLIKGVEPYKYKWSTGNNDTLPTVIYTPVTGMRKYWVVVTDSNNCVATDTVLVGSFSPSVSFLAPTTACGGAVYVAKAVLNNAIQPTYQWVGYSTNNPLLVDIPTANKNYRFILVDSFGCIVDTTLSVTVSSPKVVINGKTSICKYDTLVLTASKSGGVPPLQVSWPYFSSTADTVIINPIHSRSSYNIIVYVTDAMGCRDEDTLVVNVNTPPTVTLAPTGPYCETNSNVSLVSNANPKGGKWWGTGIINDSTFSPAVALKGTNTLAYTYLDTATGCYGADTLSVDVFGQPKADFTASKTIGLPNDTIQFVNITSNPNATTNRWDLGDFGKAGNIQTTVDAQHSYTDTGVYDVKLWVSNGICPPDSITKIAYIKIGSNYLSVPTVSKSALHIYPNPANDKLTIEAENAMQRITFIDVLGRIYTVENIINTKSTEVNIEALPIGIYIIEAKDSLGNVYRNKIQISR